MKKTRIKTDSVDELMEIVRSVQKGEDPDIDRIREERQRNREEQLREQQEKRRQEREQRRREREDFAGNAEMFDEPEKEEEPPRDDPGFRDDSGFREEPPRDKPGFREESGFRDEPGFREDEPPRKDPEFWEDEDDFDDDEFERLLDEDNTEEEFMRSKETVTALTSKAAGFLGMLLQKAGDAAGAARSGSGKRRQRRESGDGSAPLSEERGMDSEEAEIGREHLRSLERSLREQREDSQEPDFEPDWGADEAADMQGGFPGAAGDRTEPEDAPRTRRSEPEDVPRMWRTEPEDAPRTRGTGTAPGKNKAEEAGRHIPRLSQGEHAGRQPENGEGRPPRQDRGGRIRLPEPISRFFRTAGDRIRDQWDLLNQRGIHRREMIMLGIVLVFILLILFFLVTAVRNFFSQRKKSRNVTAEEGLVITVEDEPGEWASSYPVKLKIASRKGNVTSVLINGAAYTPDESGMVSVDTDSWLLQAEVTTDDGTKAARIEIPMIDGEAPSLDMKREGNEITLSAADTRSQVAGIYYAVEDPDGYSRLPQYKKYNKALAYEEGMTYRFYAKDNAGNVSVPVVTTLEDAKSFELGQTEVSLFPEETYSLKVEASPPGALLRNLKFESMDPSVVAVESDGKVTAKGIGTAAVRVSVDGMESQICTFEVDNERKIVVSTIGDCTLGTDESFNTTTNFDAFDAVNGHAYFFKNVKSILEEDDVTFANLEGTLTDETAREAKQYAFKGDPSYTDVLEEGSVEVVTLANNHSSDYGAKSLEDTKEALEEAGIDYCDGDEIVIREVNGVPMAFIGIYVLDVGMQAQEQVAQTITRARQLGAKIVVVGFHWGSESANYPDETQVALAHAAVDRGADLVVGHHPHVLQGIELYKDKYIVYSLANFCFGGNSSPSDMDTMIFQQTFTVDQDEKVKSGEIDIIPCKVSSESGYNNYQPTPASGDEAERIIGRINEYSADYGQTYTVSDKQ